MSKRKPKLLEVTFDELNAIIDLTEEGALCAENRETLRAIAETLFWATTELEKHTTTAAHLRKGLSISTKKTEKTRNVLEGVDGAEQSNADENSGEKKRRKRKRKKKAKGHGRNGADAYTGAEKIEVPHESLKAGDFCPLCEKGKLCRHKPKPLVRLRGQAPIPARLWEHERLRCNLCGEVFTAKSPPDVGEKKYDETAASMIGLLKYGSGMPFNRLARLEESFGIPLPVSTQWEVVAKFAEGLVPGWEELIRQGAQGGLFHNDDTSVKILELLKENQQLKEMDPKARTGIFTSCIMAITAGHEIALFFTGRQHAGENLEDVLKQRAAELVSPIHMCDALSRNETEFKTILCNCLSHGRRKFVEVVDSFPGECRYVLEILGEVYEHDAITREEEMSPEERLRFHQAHSAELMDDLERWMREQLEEKKVEPNSSLGGTFFYMLKRWEKFTLFLRMPGAPLDNNICYAARGITDVMPPSGLCRVDAAARRERLENRFPDGRRVGIIRGSLGRPAGCRWAGNSRGVYQRSLRARVLAS